MPQCLEKRKLSGGVFCPMVERYNFQSISNQRLAIPRSMAADDQITLEAGKIIGGKKTGGYRRPMRWKAPRGRNGMLSDFNDRLIAEFFQPLVARDIISYDIWMTVESPFNIMIDFFRRVEIGNFLMPRGFAQRMAELIAPLIASPNLMGAGALEEFFGISDAGAEKCFAGAVEVVLPDFLPSQCRRIGIDVPHVTDTGVEMMLGEQETAPPVPPSLRKSADDGQNLSRVQLLAVVSSFAYFSGAREPEPSIAIDHGLNRRHV